jgi:regulator of protease activity HflC (stomatin/prohibitin superfamily)
MWVYAIPVLILGCVAGYFAARKSTIIYPGGAALLYRKGAYVKTLDAGHHVWLDAFKATRVITLPTQNTLVRNHNITVLTKDQFSFRISVAALMQIIDARLFFEGNALPKQIYGNEIIDTTIATDIINAAAVEIFGRRTLEEVLSDQSADFDVIASRLETVMAGVKVNEVLLTQLTLPPELRKMFTEAERARKEGSAALERARSEQASLRVLANAARLLNANPQLAELRRLHSMETAKGAKTFVLGSLSTIYPGNADSE